MRSALKRDIVIIGAGFAGSLLARLLALGGREVLLVERDQHPRFALGESSTPLAALSLERLARRYGQADLRSLAAHGRWRRDLADLRCGLKRGFTFYRHYPGVPYCNGETNDARFLIAASPSDAVADCQWMRADVDAYLMEQACAAGVDYRDRLEIVAAEPIAHGLRLRGRRDARDTIIEAGFVVDASGAGEVMARALGIESMRSSIAFSSRLVYAHFEGVTPFAEVAAGAGACLSEGPYADDWAAVHHLIDEGWIYALRFDDGVVSAGLLLDDTDADTGTDGDTATDTAHAPAGVSAEARWQGALERYPTLAEAFASARPRSPGLRSTGRLQRRCRHAAGKAWAMLPQAFAFFDPMFSTGIAWSLLGVERLAEMLTEKDVSTSGLARYAALLDLEADQLQALQEAAYAARVDFAVFRELSFLYFAFVSFDEIRHRLIDSTEEVGGTAWRGFLGADDADSRALFRQARERVTDALADGSSDARRRFSDWVAGAIGSRNLIGLGDSATHLYGIDLERLIARSALLGLTPTQMESLLPKLRG
ncbi:MAG: FAD-dependent oxidoreductase [Vicinamibacterales bacterium]|nr:FAD-dependent oxidoreductase [Vicinamibacterales bacterium]